MNIHNYALLEVENYFFYFERGVLLEEITAYEKRVQHCCLHPFDFLFGIFVRLNYLIRLDLIRAALPVSPRK